MILELIGIGSIGGLFKSFLEHNMRLLCPVSDGKMVVLGTVGDILLGACFGYLIQYSELTAVFGLTGTPGAAMAFGAGFMGTTILNAVANKYHLVSKTDGSDTTKLTTILTIM